MLRNYLKVALRHLRGEMGFTIINASGLAVGLACCLFIALFVRDELSYDRHHADADRIYRVTSHYYEDDRHWAPIGPPVGPALISEFPQIESLARFFPNESPSVFEIGDLRLEGRNGGFADSTFFSFFGMPLLEGDPRSALTEPGSIVISERLAGRLFGDQTPVGRAIGVVGHGEVTVTGVMPDPPSTTHLPIDYLYPMSTFYGFGDWVEEAKTWAGFLTYIKLADWQSKTELEAQLPGFADRFLEGRFDRPASELGRYVLQPLTDIHLHSNLEKEYRANGDIAYVYTFTIVAIFILLVACVNFVNLSTARAAGRMRDVAVRKSFGAHRSQLIRQYLGEATLLAGLGLLFALVLVALLLPAFNGLTGKSLELPSVLSPGVVALLALATLIVGVVAGLYPAFVLSGYRPAQALRGVPEQGVARSLLRKGLVVFQFGISIFLIAGSAIIWQQLDYFRSKQLGFDKEHVLDVRLDNEVTEALTENPETVRNQLLQHPEVVAVSNASDVPGARYSVEGMRLEGQPSDGTIMMRVAWRSDHDYASALGLEIVRGRDFSRSEPADSNAWLINETAARRFEVGDPVGKILEWGDYSGPVVGVIRDFNFRSLHAEVEPLVIPLRPGHSPRLLVRFSSEDPRGVVAYVNEALETLYPGSYFSHSFVGESIDALYRDEDTLRNVLGYFSAIAIFVACLGLLGLAAFTAQQRRKEIGIRKVLGASSATIVGLLSREFAMLVGVAFVVAAPAVWFAAADWLSGFAYRIELDPLVFAGAGLAALLIALGTVGFQSARAAMADPVRVLRYE